MRVCELHRERAVETLVSLQDRVEYDLCPKCQELLHAILTGKESEDGPGRRGTCTPAARVKKART